MSTKSFNYFGATKYWWMLLIVGILLVIGGFAFWIWPVAGFAVASMIFGWLLVLTGIVQLCVASGKVRPRGWGWWLAGGIINTIIGFMLVCNVFLAEAVLPYFLAFIFFYWGLLALIQAFAGGRGSGWWLYLINGILLMIIAGCFCCGNYFQEMSMVSFIAALAFVYWGFVVSAFAYDLRPRRIE